MTLPTLHRLLWGVISEETQLSEWPIRTWEIPAIGLPARVATFLFLRAQETDPPPEWKPDNGPLTWRLSESDRVLSRGRQLQFGFRTGHEDEEEAVSSLADSAQPKVEKSTGWEIPPHEAYYLPLIAGGRDGAISRDSYAFYCDVLLFLTAIDGGESILDRLAQSGVGVIPFEDRWAWRSRIHLPKEAWRQIHRALRWSEWPTAATMEIRGALIRALEKPSVPDELQLKAFASERVDLRLQVTSDVEIVRTVRPPDSNEGNLPDPLLVSSDGLKDRLVVRIGQISKWPHRRDVRTRFPTIDLGFSNQIMEQVAAAFQSPDHGGQDREPELVVLPEVSVPQPEIQTVRDLVADTGRASLAGLFWRVLPSVYPPSRATSPNRRWFVNEAELVIPIGQDDRGPTSIRWYRVRKPVPSHEEKGLARALTPHKTSGTEWKILPGRRWYRFVHPEWGDFTIAICSDLLDTAPWRSLRGELLHLFMVGFNKDIDLYEALTWVRAYENYVNLVAVNHGRFGGSFLWTPRRRYHRELARLRGNRLFLLADVEIPVKGLLEQQHDGVENAVEDASKRWADQKPDASTYKSPPPRFARRAVEERNG